jgi:hypothetical protein
MEVLMNLEQPQEYGWVESVMRSRGLVASEPEHDETVSIIVGSDLLRTSIFTVLLGGLASLLVYLSICVTAGGGRSIFQFTATLAAFLACGAAASRRRKFLRFVLVLASLCAFALLIDQLAYYSWHKGVDRLVTSLQEGIESGNVRPTSFRIDPDQEVLLTFEPPVLAWTYRLDSASPLGHTLIAGWYRILSRATRGRNLDRVARTIVHPHEAYSVSVKSDERTLACREDGKGSWTLSIDTRLGHRPM